MLGAISSFILYCCQYCILNLYQVTIPMKILAAAIISKPALFTVWFKSNMLSFSKWEIVRCQYCGSRGTHRSCSSLKRLQENWVCTECRAIIHKTGN